jgi:hypothetical protein
MATALFGQGKLQDASVAFRRAMEEEPVHPGFVFSFLHACAFLRFAPSPSSFPFPSVMRSGKHLYPPDRAFFSFSLLLSLPLSPPLRFCKGKLPLVFEEHADCEEYVSCIEKILQLKVIDLFHSHPDPFSFDLPSSIFLAVDFFFRLPPVLNSFLTSPTASYHYSLSHPFIACFSCTDVFSFLVSSTATVRSKETGLIEKATFKPRSDASPTRWT